MRERTKFGIHHITIYTLIQKLYYFIWTQGIGNTINRYCVCVSVPLGTGEHMDEVTLAPTTNSLWSNNIHNSAFLPIKQLMF